MPIRKEIIHAVHELDLDELLKNLGLLEPLDKGELKCSICGKDISRENLGCFYAGENEVKVCCANTECFEKAMATRRSTHG